MKLKPFILFLAVVLCIFSGCTAEPAQSDDNNKTVDNVDTHEQQIAEYLLGQENLDYKLVKPKWDELQMISSELDYIFSFFHDDYDCSKDNMYNYLFRYTLLNSVYPNVHNKVFVSQPLQDSKQGNMRWCLLEIPQKDPLGRFPEIPRDIYDENGNIDKDFAWEYFEASGTPWLEMCIGYNKFSAEYIDWLVRDVWNGKTEHETFFEFNDGTLLYYYDGFYYTQALVGGNGGGGVYNLHIENLTPLENNLFKIEYHLTDDINRCTSCNTAIIGLKEKEDGSRFWSIFSIDYNYTGNKFNY